MRDSAGKYDVVEFPAPEGFAGRDGAPLMLRMKMLGSMDILRIKESCKRRSVAADRSGQPFVHDGEIVWKTEFDAERAARQIIAEALLYPNLKDEKLMEHYSCYDIEDMPLHVFSRPADYAYVQDAVMKTLGLQSTGKDIEKALNL